MAAIVPSMADSTATNWAFSSRSASSLNIKAQVFVCPETGLISNRSPLLVDAMFPMER
jgi:hypothetical protein